MTEQGERERIDVNEVIEVWRASVSEFNEPLDNIENAIVILVGIINRQVLDHQFHNTQDVEK